MSPTSTQQLIPERSGVGARLGLAAAVSGGTEQLLGVEGTDTLLISTGVDVEKWRADGTQMMSNAVVESGVGHAVALPNGDVVVSSLGYEDGSVQPALWLATAKADGSLCPTCVVKTAGGVSVFSLLVNPTGGVDFVLDDGTAEHWEP